MQIDSVRELKASMLDSVTAKLEAPIGIRALGLRSQAIAVEHRALRTIAFGISRKGKEHRLAIRLQRRMLEDHAILEQIRSKAKGEVDIRYVGKILKMETATQLQKRRRPLVIGCSIGHYKVTAGTLGSFVLDRKTGQLLILSNNHVLANENNAKTGDAIIQPGDADDGAVPSDVIGKLVRFVRLKPSATNFIDCAVASISDGIKLHRVKLGSLGNLAGLRTDQVIDGTQVYKVGRTTGQTKGKVTAFELDNVVIEYDLGNLRFDNQIEIEGAGSQAFSDGGDSGSLIVDKDRQAVALLFAGGDQGGSNGKGLTYGNPIESVLDALKVDLVT